MITVQQPYFLPWLGYFAKLNRADHLIVLDENKYRRNHISRVRFLDQSGRVSWLSLPIGASQNQRINSISVELSKKFLKTSKLRLFHAYRSSGSFDEIWPIVEELFDIIGASSTKKLSDLNVELLKSLLKFLRLPEPSISLSSDLEVSEDRSKRLLEFLKMTSSSSLLIGDGASEQIHDFSEIRTVGMKVYVCPFFAEHPVYTHTSSKKVFHRGLSVLDALFELGTSETKRLIESVEVHELR